MTQDEGKLLSIGDTVVVIHDAFNTFNDGEIVEVRFIDEAAGINARSADGRVGALVWSEIESVSGVVFNAGPVDIMWPPLVPTTPQSNGGDEECACKTYHPWHNPVHEAGCAWANRRRS